MPDKFIAIRSAVTARETRFVECRFAAEADGSPVGVFTGYASLFNTPDSYGDQIRPGSFKRTLKESKARGINPPMLWSHDPSKLIGKWIDIREDERGLAVTGQLVCETALGSEVYSLMKAGALSGMSIGFRTRKAEAGPGGTRILSDLDLAEISLVAMPAADGARITQVRTASGHASSAVTAFIRACSQASQTFQRKD
jgi:HK97 family phage prohead protease